MNLKRILVLVMTFAMLVTTFVPALTVFAEELDEGHTHETETKHYVSIGDSMTNGYGFEGYKQGKIDITKFIAGDGVYGQGSYALQFEDYLKAQGYDVTHTKLAASALRAEDLNYLLGGRDDAADDWFDQVLYYTTGSGDNKHLIPQLSEYYQNAVKDADIISLGIGNASFGAFMLSRVTSALGVMGGSLDDEQVEMYTLENALALLENEDDKAQVLELYNKFYTELSSYVDPTIAEQYKLETVCDIFAYICANYMLNFAGSIDRIVELNEKENLEIILVGMMNTTYGMEITLDNGDSIPFGDIMDELFGLLNAYMAGYPTAKQAAGEYAGVTFYYAEQPQPIFILQSYDELAESGWQNVDGGRLDADTIRERTISTYNESLRLMLVQAMFPVEFHATYTGYLSYGYSESHAISAAAAHFLPEISLEHVKEYDATGYCTDSSVIYSVAVYRGIEDAIVKSIEVEDLPLTSLITLTGDLSGLLGGMTIDMSSPVALQNSICAGLTSEELLPLVKCYAIFSIGNGMCVHPTPSGHDAIYESIVKAYESNWTVQKQTIKNAYDYVLEYYDEAYLLGYQFADENGYIDLSVEAIDKAIVALENVDLSVLGTTETLTKQIAAEIEATIATLREIREVLATDSAKDVEGFAAAVLELEDDLYRHLNNISTILTQAGIDVNQLVILPALREAIRIIEEEVIPAIIATVEAFVQAVVDQVKAQLGVVYNELIDALLKLQLYYGEKIESALRPIINLYYTLVEIYGTVEEALRVLNEVVINVINTVEGNIENAVELFNVIVNVLVNVYGTIENIVVVASQIFSHVYAFVSENVTPEQIQKLYNDIKDIVIAAYGESDDVYYVAAQVYAYIANLLKETLEGDYELTADSLYVSLGNAVYGEELAEMLHLSDKYFNFEDLSDYDADQLAEADLITVRFDNGETFMFIFTQILSYGEDLDWSNYLDEEGEAALDETLETIETQLLASGQMSYVAEALAANFDIDAEELPEELVADIAVYVIESALYAYAEFADRVVTTLEDVYEIAPEATVVITGVQNPLNDLDLGLDLTEFTDSFDYVIDIVNLQILALATLNENTIFVNSVEAADIYDALNVHCAHAYDDCLDDTCNICGETREVTGHNWTVVSKTEANCVEAGTETVECVNCGAVATNKTSEALGHSYGEWVTVKEATTSSTGLKERTCSRCGDKQSETIAMLPPEPATTSPWAVVAVVVIVAAYLLLTKKGKKVTASPKKEEKNNEKK